MEVRYTSEGERLARYLSMGGNLKEEKTGQQLFFERRKI